MSFSPRRSTLLLTPFKPAVAAAEQSWVKGKPSQEAPSEGGELQRRVPVGRKSRLARAQGASSRAEAGPLAKMVGAAFCPALS